ncbi:DUF3343 domain-containing protein [Thermoanaerobacterium sp. DL9XJH110]|uniref:DUF3343 domain-containing protein n=1 Tax=Thermoanaerobacterium sp. DL9XJH110 TaxID=3386643 RepID=UPI003BB4E2E7
MQEAYPYFIVTFPSVHYALRFESKLKGSSLSFRLVPAPREISSSCGVAARVFESNAERIISLMKEKDLQYDALYVYKAPKEKPVPLELLK